MDWDAISAISEVAAAAAVVASIGYLAVQIRQNTRFSKAASQLLPPLTDVLPWFGPV